MESYDNEIDQLRGEVWAASRALGLLFNILVNLVGDDVRSEVTNYIDNSWNTPDTLRLIEEAGYKVTPFSSGVNAFHDRLLHYFSDNTPT